MTHANEVHILISEIGLDEEGREQVLKNISG